MRYRIINVGCICMYRMAALLFMLCCSTPWGLGPAGSYAGSVILVTQ